MVAGSSCTNLRRAAHRTGLAQGLAPALVPGPVARPRTRVHALAPGPALAPDRRPSPRPAGRAAPTARATAPAPGAGARHLSAATRRPSRPLPSGTAQTTEPAAGFLAFSFFSVRLQAAKSGFSLSRLPFYYFFFCSVSFPRSRGRFHCDFLMHVTPYDESLQSLAPYCRLLSIFIARRKIGRRRRHYCAQYENAIFYYILFFSQGWILPS